MENKDSEKLKDHEKRLIRLENAVFGGKSDQSFKKNKTYEGMTGGIQLLIDNKFLNSPKNVDEIV